MSRRPADPADLRSGSLGQRRIVIATAADETYAAMMFELIASIREYPQSGGLDIAVVDVGLSAESRARAEREATRVTEGRWELDVDAGRFRDRRFLQARIAKIAMNAFFPGYDLYIWIDADAWLCDWAAIDLLIRGAERRGMAATYDVSDDGSAMPVSPSWLLGRWPVVRTWALKHARRGGVSAADCRRLAFRTPFNNGVFALTAEAPHWQALRAHMTGMLGQGGRIFGSNQLALLMAVELDGLDVERLPLWCNYTGIPALCAETGRLVEPYLPHTPIGIMHLADRDKMRADRAATMALAVTDGTTRQASLRYRPLKERTAA